jgi:CheY-like chemotaxis protein
MTSLDAAVDPGLSSPGDEGRPRLLVVDDEEAILETMEFTFMDLYEVITTTDPRRALQILDEKSPISVVLTDQRMPEMTGVELLREVYATHPETVRIILTGFADSESTIKAINDGHVYAYVDKPWEPAELKQIVKRAVELHGLSVENRNLVDRLGRSNRFLEAVMDRFDTGALALDPEGVIQAANKPAREYLKINADPIGIGIGEILVQQGLESIGEAVRTVSEEKDGSFEDLEVRVDGTAHRLRISAQVLRDHEGERLGRVLLFKEISHEPLRRTFDEIVVAVGQQEGSLRGLLLRTFDDLAALGARVSSSGIASPNMAQLKERVTWAQTAIQSWLEVDDMLNREDYPDAQLLIDRMRLANKRWPQTEELPERVKLLVARVESYYESGENPKQRVL